MSNSLQDFLAAATRQETADLVAALDRLPEDKRTWSPSETSRTAIDQVAECAMINGFSANYLETRDWGPFSFEAYLEQKSALVAQGQSKIVALLNENTEKLIANMAKVPEEGLADAVETPFGPSTIAKIMAYPYWNMGYHEGQINYIASILESAK